MLTLKTKIVSPVGFDPAAVAHRSLVTSRMQKHYSAARPKTKQQFKDTAMQFAGNISKLQNHTPPPSLRMLNTGKAVTTESAPATPSPKPNIQASTDPLGSTGGLQPKREVSSEYVLTKK